MKQTLSSRGIGASEISAIVGMNPFASPWDIWLRKTGQAPDVESNAAIEWGHRLEPAIRQKYADDTGAIMYVPAESLFHEAFPWARATPDAIVVNETFHGNESVWPRFSWTHLVQCKNVGFWMGKEWEDGLPVYVQIQELWEMHVTGLGRADVAALIAGSDFRVYTAHRDDKMIGDLHDIAADFWRRVETRTPPNIDDSTACRDHFTRRLAKSELVELTADAEVESTIAEWRERRRALKREEAAVARLRNAVLSTMTAAQADRIVSTFGTPKLARTPAREHKSTDWKYVAEMLATATGARETFAELVSAATTTTTTEPTVSLREPSMWSKEKPR